VRLYGINGFADHGFTRTVLPFRPNSTRFVGSIM
jgi:hypothetical protein